MKAIVMAVANPIKAMSGVQVKAAPIDNKIARTKKQGPRAPGKLAYR
jgi:hypothetical protein